MRKFLIEMEQEITLDELRRDYETGAVESDGESFPRYLELCMARNNGALTEILTEDTPSGERRGAVTLCRVSNPDDCYDEWEEWLTEQEMNRKRSYGCGVSPLA